MKTIGVLGGMGPAATVDFYRRIVDLTDARRDQDHMHVLIDSDPSVPDRTACLLGQGADPTPTLITMAQRLERAGAEVLVMACNTASAFSPGVAAAVAVPLLDWTDEAAAGVVARHPHLARIGVLATTGTVTAGLYQRAFAQRGVTVVVPPPLVQDQVMEGIYGPAGVKAGATDLRQAGALVTAAADALVDAGAEALLLACTELSVLFAAGTPPWPVPTYDAAHLVAERVITLAGGRLAAHAGARTP